MMQVGTKFVPTNYDAGGYKKLAKVFMAMIQSSVNVNFLWSQYFVG